MFKFKMKISKPNKNGFTLIELLMVISIIGLLSSVVLSSLSAARVKARDANRKKAFSEIQKALELYYLEYGSYPTGQASNNVCASDWGCWNKGGYFANKLSPYLSILPQDPNYLKRGSSVSCPNWYAYAYERKSPTTYCIAGTLENLKDHSAKPCSPNVSCHSSWPNFTVKNY